jgi:hypothetical protein
MIHGDNGGGGDGGSSISSSSIVVVLSTWLWLEIRMQDAITI